MVRLITNAAHRVKSPNEPISPVHAERVACVASR